MADRSKYKGTKLSGLKEKKEKEDREIPSQGSMTFHKMDSGKNTFRIFPAKPGEDAFYQMKCVHWVSVPGEKGKLKRTNVLNAVHHGGYDTDVIDEYIRFVKNHTQNIEASEAQRIMDALNHWQDGLNPQFSWLCYANKITEQGTSFGILEFRKSVRDGLNDAALADEDEEFDPFTDPDNGLPVIITYDKDALPKDKYKVATKRKPLPLTDEELEMFDEQRSLSGILGEYNENQFETALKGLEIFDEEHDIDIFNGEDFQAIVRQISKQIQKNKKSDDEDEKASSKKTSINKDDEDEAPTKEASSKDEDEQEEEYIDDLSDMDADDLKELIDEEEMGITYRQSTSAAVLRKRIRKHRNEMNASSKPKKDEEVDDEDEDNNYDAEAVKKRLRNRKK